MEKENAEGLLSDEDEEMFVEVEPDELDTDGTLVSSDACSGTAVVEAATTQHCEVSNTTAVSEMDSTTVVISSSGTATSVCNSDEVLVLSSEHTMSDTEKSSVLPTETASVNPIHETDSTVMSHTPMLRVVQHAGSDNVKVIDVTQAASVNLQKLAMYSGLKDVRIALTRIETKPENLSGISSSSVIEQEGTELSLPLCTDADEALRHGVGVKRPLIGSSGSTEGSPQKQQKMEDSSSSLSVVACDDVSVVFSNTSEHPADTVEKSETTESKQEITSVPADLDCIAQEDVTTVEQSVTDGLSPVNDTIADVVVVDDSSPAVDSLAPATSVSNIEHLAVTDNDKSELEEVIDMQSELNSVVVEDVKTRGQLVTEEASSLIPDAVTETIAVNDNSVAADNIAPMISVSNTTKRIFVVDNSEQEVTATLADLDFVAAEDVKTDEQLVSDGLSSVNDTIAGAIADVDLVDDSSLPTDSMISATTSDLMAVEDVKAGGQSVTDEALAEKNAIANAIADVIVIEDTLPAVDSLVSTVSVSDNKHLSVIDNKSEQEVTGMQTNSNLIAVENVKTDGQLVTDGVSPINDAIADAIADVIAVSDNSVVTDSIAATASVTASVVNDNNSEPEITGMQTESSSVTVEGVEIDRRLVDEGKPSLNDDIAAAIADVIAVKDSPLAADSPSLSSANRAETHTADKQHQQKVTGMLNGNVDTAKRPITRSAKRELVLPPPPNAGNVDTGKKPVTRSAKRELVLPPPPSVTNAGSKMRMRMEAANTEKPPASKEKLPASPAVKAYKTSRWSTAVESAAVGSSSDPKKPAAFSTKDVKAALASDKKSPSKLSDQRGKMTQRETRFSDAKKIRTVMEWRPLSTKSAVGTIPTTSGAASSADRDWRLFPAQHPSLSSTSSASLPASLPAKVGQSPDGNIKSSISSLQLQAVTSSFCAPLHDVDMRQPPPNVSLPVAGQMPVMVASQPPLSLPVGNVQLQNTALAPVVLHVVQPPAVPPSIGARQISGGQAIPVPVQVNLSQPPPQIVPSPAPAVLPPPVQPAVVLRPATNRQIAPPGVVTAIGPGGPTVAPSVVPPPVVPPPTSSVRVQTPPHIVPTNQQPPPMSFSQPPPAVLPQSHVGSSPGQTIPPGIAPPVTPVVQAQLQMAPAAAGSKPPILPTPNVSPHSHIGSSSAQPVPSGVVQPVTPVQMAPAVTGSKPPILPTPNVSPHSHVGSSSAQPVPSGVVRPVTPVAPDHIAPAASRNMNVTPLQPAPPPTNARFGPNRPPYPVHRPLPVPPVYRPPPQQSSPQSRDPLPPGVVSMQPAVKPAVAPGPRQPPPQWGPVPSHHAAPSMWGPHVQGAPPQGFHQPYPGSRHPAAPPDWRPPPENSLLGAPPPENYLFGAPYMQPGQNWTPPMDYPPHATGWWPPPSRSMPPWGAPQAPPDWSSQHSAGTATSDSGDSKTAAIAKAAREWADWQQRYSEWYYKYFGSTAVTATVPTSSAASTANYGATDTDLRLPDTDLRQKTAENRHKTKATSFMPAPSAPTRTTVKEVKVLKSNAASAIPLPASKPSTTAKTGGAAAFAKFAEKAAANINFVLGAYGNNPISHQNVVNKSKTLSTNVSSTVAKPSEGEYLFFIVIMNFTYHSCH